VERERGGKERERKLREEKEGRRARVLFPSSLPFSPLDG
jgi:hypothetical protein